MSLTPEQVAIRKDGLGASEISAVLEMNPFKSPIDVWLSKVGRHVDDEEETNKSITGGALEPGLCQLYTDRTGFHVHRPLETYRHPEHPRVLASPDGFAFQHGFARTPLNRSHGLEIKCVGFRMKDRWSEDTVPAYVDLQCRQNMAVLNLDRWDVLALIDNEIHIYQIDRDLEIETMLIETAEWFWDEYVSTNTPPPVEEADERRRYLKYRYPGAIGAEIRQTSDPDVWELARWLRECKEQRKALEAAEKQLTNAMIEVVGNDAGIKGPWGKAIMSPMRGAISYKDLAEDIAGGLLRTEQLDKHRGESYRKFGFYPAHLKAKK